VGEFAAAVESMNGASGDQLALEDDQAAVEGSFSFSLPYGKAHGQSEETCKF
jgi:hypothetical protein